MGNFNSWVSGSKNEYLYNGKKLQEDGGLNVYDYGAKYYDPWGKITFWGVDPLAEKYPSQSPYVYAANNPVRYTDVMGMGVIDYIVKKAGEIANRASVEVQYRANQVTKVVESAYNKVDTYVKANGGKVDAAVKGSAPEAHGTDKSMTVNDGVKGTKEGGNIHGSSPIQAEHAKEQSQDELVNHGVSSPGGGSVYSETDFVVETVVNAVNAVAGAIDKGIDVVQQLGNEKTNNYNQSGISEKRRNFNKYTSNRTDSLIKVNSTKTD